MLATASQYIPQLLLSKAIPKFSGCTHPDQDAVAYSCIIRVFQSAYMSIRAGWYALLLAAACVSGCSTSLESIAGAIATEFDSKEMKAIWYKAKIALQPQEIDWLQQQLGQSNA